MTFRTRIAIALGLGALLPLGLLAYGVRREMTRRLVSQVDERVQLQVVRAGEQLQATARSLDSRLSRLARSLADDNRFRLAVIAGETSAPWLRDWARETMAQSELDLLELVDSTGLILSSGHFRNEFGQRHPGLARAVAGDSAPVVLLARTPTVELMALARVNELEIAGRRFSLIGGTALDLGRLFPGASPELSVSFLANRRLRADSGGVEIPLRFVAAGDSASVSEAAIVLTRDPGPILAIRRSVDRWFLGTSALVLLVVVGIALWLSRRVTRPLAALAEKTATVDLDRLDQSFATGGSDEIAALGRLLDDMTERLRASSLRLREAERRAVTGDLARQINHDVKNGLAPIRHVLRHLTQVARDQPGELPAIYQERVGTLESSVAYLENLSRNYARLSPAVDRSTADLNGLLQEVARTLGSSVPVHLRLGEGPAPVRADAVALRRIVENLAGNAVDAAGANGGEVTLLSESLRRDGSAWVRLVVADSGSGMSREELDRAFDDFFTTKDGGTGLGLSVVRRLVADLGGTLRVETAPGQGSRFIVELPSGESR